MGDMSIADLVPQTELQRLKLRAMERGEPFEVYLRDVLSREANKGDSGRRARKEAALKQLAMIRARSKPMSEEEADHFFDELRRERDERGAWMFDKPR